MVFDYVSYFINFKVKREPTKNEQKPTNKTHHFSFCLFFFLSMTISQEERSKYVAFVIDLFNKQTAKQTLFVL